MTVILFCILVVTLRSNGQQRPKIKMLKREQIIMPAPANEALPQTREHAEKELEALQQKIQFEDVQKADKVQEQEFVIESIYKNPEGLDTVSKSLYAEPSEVRTDRLYDSRFEVTFLNPLDSNQLALINNSFGILGIASASDLIDHGDDSLRMAAVPSLAMRYHVCASEPYRDQPCLCSGTAFVIHENFALTALHNLEYNTLQELVLIPDFKLLTRSGKYARAISRENVFRISEVIQLEDTPDIDMALLRLDHPAAPHQVLVVDSVNTVQTGNDVYTLGHPMGMPMKLTINASVRQVTQDHFYATLDTYQGNSGSPVFDYHSHRVTGIVLEGMTDFISKGDCMTSNLCLVNCKGEKVLKLAQLWPQIRDIIERYTAESVEEK